MDIFHDILKMAVSDTKIFSSIFLNTPNKKQNKRTYGTYYQCKKQTLLDSSCFAIVYYCLTGKIKDTESSLLCGF